MFGISRIFSNSDRKPPQDNGLVGRDDPETDILEYDDAKNDDLGAQDAMGASLLTAPNQNARDNDSFQSFFADMEHTDSIC